MVWIMFAKNQSKTSFSILESRRARRYWERRRSVRSGLQQPQREAKNRISSRSDGAQSLSVPPQNVRGHLVSQILYRYRSGTRILKPSLGPNLSDFEEICMFETVSNLQSTKNLVSIYIYRIYNIYM